MLQGAAHTQALSQERGSGLERDGGLNPLRGRGRGDGGGAHRAWGLRGPPPGAFSQGSSDLKEIPALKDSDGAMAGVAAAEAR